MNTQNTSMSDQDNDFFKEAVQVFSSSILIDDVMRATFDFFDRHFPLDGINLHRFDMLERTQHNLFLVTRDNFYYLDTKFQISESSMTKVTEIERATKIRIADTSKGIRPAEIQSKAFAKYLPDIDRARLTAILSTKKIVVGHFSLLGKTTACFTVEHIRKIEILLPVLGLFILNLLQYHEISQLKNRLAERNRYLTGRLRYLDQRMIIGEEGGLRHVKDMVTLLSGQDIPVLITGETGTGKELIADAVQRISTRYDEPYVKINCAAIPESLIDSELFGHEKGSFTGADKIRYGKFEQAKGGTLFLDEIGDMPLNAQVRLLRVLQDGHFQRLGGSSSILGDVRIIAATHQNLHDLVAMGKFREDLFYRLNVFPVTVPPLRERVQDIPTLIAHFIAKKTRQMSITHTPLIDEKSLPILMSYTWPGNVRELENLVERALAVDPNGPLKLHKYLPVIVNQQQHQSKNETEPLTASSLTSVSSGIPVDESILNARRSMATLDQTIVQTIRQALILCNGKISGPKGAAELLDVNPSTLTKRMNKLGIPHGRNIR